jgi:hypothetical protein
MELSPPWEAASCAITQEFLNILCNLKVHYCGHKNPLRPFVTFHNKVIFLRWIVSPMPKPQAGRPPLDGCPQLLNQYIHSYPPHLEAVSSIHNLRTYHAVVTWDPLNMAFFSIIHSVNTVFIVDWITLHSSTCPILLLATFLSQICNNYSQISQGLAFRILSTFEKTF